MHSNNQLSQERHLLLFNDSARKLISLTQESYKIGRGILNEIVIEGNPISRIHARLRRIGNDLEGKGQYQLLDGATDEKPSKNGIFLNNIRFTSHTLQSGDVVSFANIIKALYLKADLSHIDFEKFQETIVSDHLLLGTFLDNEMVSAVDSHLSNLDHTTIMLGGASLLSNVLSRLEV
jgi:pSer/pThr/pTyr-binding forkhead associated (FHA) protein